MKHYICWRGIINSTILGDPWDGLWDPHPRIQLLTDTSKTLAWGFPILLLTPPRRSSPHISPSSYLEPGVITISLWMDGCCFGIHHSSIPKPTSTALFSSALGDPKTILHAGPPTYTDLPPYILSRELPLGTDVPLYGSTQVRPHTEISHIVTNHHVTVTLSLSTSFSPLHQFFF